MYALQNAVEQAEAHAASKECEAGLRSLVKYDAMYTAARNESLRTGKELCVPTSQDDIDFIHNLSYTDANFHSCIINVTSIAGRQSDSTAPLLFPSLLDPTTRLS